MSPTWKIGAGVGGVVVAAAVVVVLLTSGGEEKEVRRAIEAAIEAVKRGDADGAILYVSRDYDDGTNQYAAIERYVREAAQMEVAKYLSIEELEVTVVGPVATAKLTLKAPMNMPLPYGMPNTIRLTFQREEAPPRWKLRSGKYD